MLPVMRGLRAAVVLVFPTKSLSVFCSFFCIPWKERNLAFLLCNHLRTLCAKHRGCTLVLPNMGTGSSKDNMTSASNNSFRLFAVLLALAVFCVPISAQQPQPDEVRGAPAEPADAAEARAQIAFLEKLQPTFPDRGAVLYYLAALHQHLGETLEATKRLKDCIALGEGFDPSGEREFAGLHASHEFTELVEKVHREFPIEAHARLVLVTEEKNLIPEGLAWDPNRKVFYLSSLAQKKIVQITPESHASDFVPAGRDHLLPVLGIRLDPRDNSIWANTEDDLGKAELVHYNPAGNLLGRFSLADSLASGSRGDDSAKHGFNDLVVLKSGEIFLTDSLANQVYRFDPATKSFEGVKTNRELLYPNGIALSSDDKHLFIADGIGVIHVNLETGASADIHPGAHSTLAGADGLYWYNGGLIAVQNGIGSPRVAAFKLSDDSTRVTRTTVLENRTSFTSLP